MFGRIALIEIVEFFILVVVNYGTVLFRVKGAILCILVNPSNKLINWKTFINDELSRIQFIQVNLPGHNQLNTFFGLYLKEKVSARLYYHFGLMDCIENASFAMVLGRLR